MFSDLFEHCKYFFLRVPNKIGLHGQMIADPVLSTSSVWLHGGVRRYIINWISICRLTLLNLQTFWRYPWVEENSVISLLAPVPRGYVILYVAPLTIEFGFTFGCVTFHASFKPASSKGRTSFKPVTLVSPQKMEGPPSGVVRDVQISN